MDTSRLKLRIGQHEFEAEGSPESVQAQFQAFKELVELTASQPAPRQLAPNGRPGREEPAEDESDEPSETPPPPRPTDGTTDAQLGQIMNSDNRIVSLTVRAEDPSDAVLLLLYGQKVLRNTDTVMGSQVTQGLKVSGERVSRPDRLLDRHGENGLVIVVGERRSKRYRLTNRGLTEARRLAAALIATVA